MLLKQLTKVVSVAPSRSYAFSQSKIHKYELSGTSEGWISNGTSPSGSKVSTDLPQKAGGKGAPTPIDLVLGAIVGCEFITGQAIAKKYGFTLKKTKYQVVGERDDLGIQFKPFDADAPVTSALQKIDGTILVETDGTQEQLDLLEKILKKRCPVARMVVDSGCKVNIKWQKVDKIPN